MFKIIIVLSYFFSTLAFSSVARVPRSSVMKMSYDNEIGVLPPVGFWDPLGNVD
jgi:hypothetical protein